MSYLNGKKYLMKTFVVEFKFILIELKIYFDSMKKSDIIKIYFTEYKFILSE